MALQTNVMTAPAPAPAFAAEAVAPAETPTLTVKGLNVEFSLLSGDTVRAIRDFDLELAPGEIFGLIGEGGSGKTVLARALLNYVRDPGRIASGRLVFEGEDITHASDRRMQRLRGSRMSLIAANPRGELNPIKTVGEQIARMARLHLKLNRAKARALTLDMLRAVQIPDPERRYDAYPHELSGGMAQRIVIAIALICSPRFVVADDATSGLDVTVQTQVLDLLRTLTQERGSSLMLITRDMGITAHYCDRVAIMYQGELVETGTRESLFLSPRHPYTIMLMAAFSHNDRLREIWSAPAPVSARAVARQGCAYAARCPLATEICLTHRPEAEGVAPRHKVRCHNMVQR